jgi:hypothetical protein
VKLRLAVGGREAEKTFCDLLADKTTSKLRPILLSSKVKCFEDFIKTLQIYRPENPHSRDISGEISCFKPHVGESLRDTVTRLQGLMSDYEGLLQEEGCSAEIIDAKLQAHKSELLSALPRSLPTPYNITISDKNFATFAELEKELERLILLEKDAYSPRAHARVALVDSNNVKDVNLTIVDTLQGMMKRMEQMSGKIELLQEAIKPEDGSKITQDGRSRSQERKPYSNAYRSPERSGYANGNYGRNGSYDYRDNSRGRYEGDSRRRDDQGRNYNNYNRQYNYRRDYSNERRDDYYRNARRNFDNDRRTDQQRRETFSQGTQAAEMEQNHDYKETFPYNTQNQQKN